MDRVNQLDTFSDACAKYFENTGKAVLSIEDKREISRIICKSRITSQVTSSSSSKHKITVISAYSENYVIGKLCQQVNSIYCETHGYEFICHVLPQMEMEAIIAPRSHCTWYKVKMIIDILTTKLSESESGNSEYLFWIDSDAIVIDQSQAAESFVERGHCKDLIIAEDMSPCCLVNAGVMMIKVSQWSLSLWTDVWSCSQYFQRPFYEQAALIKCLKLRQEGLQLYTPFHTYLPGALTGDKVFQHVAVFPSIDFNTNRGYVSNRSPKFQRKFNRSQEKLKRREREFAAQEKANSSNIDELSIFHLKSRDESESTNVNNSTIGVIDTSTSSSSEIETSEKQRNEDRPRFIYHAAGRCDKLVSLEAVAQMYGLPFDTNIQ
jgi:hypothetical protein